MEAFLYDGDVVVFVPPTMVSGPCIIDNDGTAPLFGPCGPVAQCDGLARYLAQWRGNELFVAGRGWRMVIGTFVHNRFEYHGSGLTVFQRINDPAALTATEMKMLREGPLHDRSAGAGSAE